MNFHTTRGRWLIPCALDALGVRRCARQPKKGFLLRKQKNNRSFKPTFECLESRHMLSASASILGNVLNITGSNNADTITVHLRNNLFTIDGIATAFNAKKVKSISIDCLYGNDTVRLNTLSGFTAINVPVTVKSGGGSEHVIDAKGKDWYFSGLGSSLVSNAQGAVTINQVSNNNNNSNNNNSNNNTQATNWFDANVQDTGIRTLGKQQYRDGSLSRNDMIALFRSVETGGVTATELADLKKIVSTTTLFGSATYVQVLSNKIVNGDPANAHYQGTALGNLAAGASGAKLEKLVSKWFLGTDHPTGKSDWGTTYNNYVQASGQLFAHAPAYSDIVQGGLGDCYLLSSLAETALKNPNAITSMFIVNGDGTYTVRFYNNGKADFVTVDGKLPVDSYGRLVFGGMGAMANNAGNTLWVALAEKAYVQMNESGWMRPASMGGGTNVYTAISGGYMADAMKQITGRATTGFQNLNNANTLLTAWNAGKEICLATLSTPASSSIVGGHAYAIVGYNATTQQYTLFNPWGINSGSSKPGLVTMTFAQIKANFDYFDQTA